LCELYWTSRDVYWTSRRAISQYNPVLDLQLLVAIQFEVFGVAVLRVAVIGVSYGAAIL